MNTRLAVRLSLMNGDREDKGVMTYSNKFRPAPTEYLTMIRPQCNWSFGGQDLRNKLLKLTGFFSGMVRPAAWGSAAAAIVCAVDYVVMLALCEETAATGGKIGEGSQSTAKQLSCSGVAERYILTGWRSKQQCCAVEIL